MNRLLGIFLAIVLVGCATPDRTVPLTGAANERAYLWPVNESGTVKPAASDLSDTLVVVTASGGGTRAAALTLGALRGLQNVPLPGTQQSLVDEVDIVSSVSGGSVTAAYFALKGPAGFENLSTQFLKQDGIGELVGRLLNPVTLAETATPSRSRLDVLIDYLDESLFQDSSYGTLAARGARPYLILNAADMSEGSVFSFTQGQFDLICSDLAQFKLAESVAASAAFPVALAPLTLRNHSPCPAQTEGLVLDRSGEPLVWPPRWVENGVRTSIYTDPRRVLRARRAMAYLNGDDAGPPAKRYVHLLDGGIADNLGLTEPLWLLNSNSDPDFVNAIVRGEIRNIVFVIVNARSDKDPELDGSGATPGMLAMLQATVGSAIDNATFGMLGQMDGTRATLRTLLLLNFPPEMHAALEEFRIFLVPVDFDYIDDPGCRQAFKEIPTSWTLSDRQVDGLVALGEALIVKAPGMNEFRIRRFGEAPGGTSSEDTACKYVIADAN